MSILEPLHDLLDRRRNRLHRSRPDTRRMHHPKPHVATGDLYRITPGSDGWDVVNARGRTILTGAPTYAAAARAAQADWDWWGHREHPELGRGVKAVNVAPLRDSRGRFVSRATVAGGSR